MSQLDLNNPVVTLTGNEFLPKQEVTFAQQVLEFFILQGGVAHSPWGEVLLDRFTTCRSGGSICTRPS